MRGALHEGKELAQETNEPALVELRGGRIGRVHPKGRGVYKYVVEVDGLQFEVADREKPNEQHANVRVVCGSLECMRRGLVGVWKAACGVLADLGFSMSGHVISRVDLCVDRSGVDLAAVCVGYVQRCYVTFGVKGAMYDEGPVVTGFTKGIGGPISLRVYDKGRELMGEDARGEKIQKHEYLEEHRWEKRPGRHVRVEFQIRREVLRERFSINTIDELITKCKTLWRYLTHEWFRMTDEPPDRKHNNQRRADTSGFWEDVQKAGEQWMEGMGEDRLERRAKALPKLTQLKKQAMGCLKTVLAVEGAIVRSTGEAVAEIVRRLMEFAPADLVGEVHQRRQELATQGVLVCGMG